MHQKYRLDGTEIPYYKPLPKLLKDAIRHLDSVPHGIIDLDMESGLVKVELSEGKTALMKLGKLLKKTGHTDKEARDISSKLRSEVLLYKGAKLSFTDSSEEAMRVYEDGPHSCMANQECVGAYYSDDVAVAYVDIGGKIIARSVVCKNEDIGLQYMCIYGNRDIMLPLLTAAGYERGDLNGCTLTRLVHHHNGEVMMPYLDCGTKVEDCGTHLEVRYDGQYGTQNTNGTFQSFACDECGADVGDEDELWYSDYYDERQCESCHEKFHIYYNDEWYGIDSDNVVLIGNDHHHIEECEYIESSGEYALTEDCSYSDYSEQYYLTNDVINAVTNVEYPDGELCYDGDCTKASDGNWVHDDILEEYEEYNNPQEELDLED